MEHRGNLPFRLEAGDLDWCSRGGVAAAARNLLCLPAHFDVPDLVTALKVPQKLPPELYLKK